MAAQAAARSGYVSETPHSGESLASITAMRFWAALLVFLFHVSLFRLFADKELSEDFFSTLSKAGFVGVSFFFILSGFILTWVNNPARSPRRFWRQRFFKIFPNHVVAYVLALVLFAGSMVSAPTAVLNLFLLQSWVPHPTTFFSVNNPNWSLSCEVFLYAMFPALYAAVRRIRPERLWWWAGGVVAGIVAVPVIATIALPGGPSFDLLGEPMPMLRTWFVYVLPATRLLDFALGMLMARIVLSGRWIGLKLAPAVLLLAVGYVVALLVPDLFGLVAATAVPLALLVPAAATAGRSGRPESPNRLLRRLGEISFAFYVVQWPVMYFGYRQLGVGSHFSTWVSIGLIVSAFTLTLLLAELLHRFVECPVMRTWGKGRAVRRSARERPAEESIPSIR